MGRSLHVLVVLAIAAVVGSCGSNGSGPPTPTGSTLSPSAIATSSPSPSDVGPFVYTAQVFMAGMQVIVPSSHWSIHEDHPGEFNLSAPSPAIANIHFWLDPYPSLKNDKPHP